MKEEMDKPRGARASRLNERRPTGRRNTFPATSYRAKLAHRGYVTTPVHSNTTIQVLVSSRLSVSLVS
jgi:hypothetical protein